MNGDVRETYHSEEYDLYYATLDERIRVKYDYVEAIIKSQYVVSQKFVKHLENSEFYEARVSVGSNEYRTVLFAIDTASFMGSKRVLFLNSFLKKNNKQYRSEVEKARKILTKYIEEEGDND